MIYQKKKTALPGYEVDTNGVVWTFWRVGKITNRAKILNPTYKSRDGYIGVTMKCLDGKPRPKMLHRLLAETFIPNPENKPQVAHNNGIKSDNRLENLRWATAKENIADRILHGTAGRGENHSQAKLTEKKIRVIKWALYYGAPVNLLAKDFGVSGAHIGRIKNGKQWADIKI